LPIPRRKYEQLLADKDVGRWFKNLSRGSIITATVYLRRLGAFCQKNKISPKEIIALPQKEINNLLLDMVSDLAKEGKAGSYISSNLKALKSWLAYNEVEIKVKIKIEGAEDSPTLKDERVPSQDELRKILLSSDLQQRTAASFLAFSGFRPESLGDYEGKDGLVVGDLLELEIKGDKVSFSKIPTLVKVRNNLSKAGHAYFTFLNDEGCQYVKEYLELRLRKEETITKDSPIITLKKANVQKKIGAFIHTNNIGDMIRAPIRKAGFPWRPYVLRAYFDTQMMIAESKGLILRDYRAFFMGHKGDIENHYTTNKGKLPDSVIEDMRQAYKRASQYLVTVRSKDESVNLLKDFKEGLLLSKRVTPQEIKKIDVLSMSNEEFFKLLNQKKDNGQAEAPMILQRDGGSPIVQAQQPGRHTSIPLAQLSSFLASGCLYVDKYTDPETSLPMAIIQYPL
jgi:hypothetical protein